MSVVRATGRQALGGIIVLVSYYVFALPTGVPLMFRTKLGLAGIALSIRSVNNIETDLQYRPPFPLGQETLFVLTFSMHKINFTVEFVSLRNGKSKESAF